MVVRLEDSHALALGLTINKKPKDGNAKYYLNRKNQQLYLKLKNSGVVQACENVGADPTSAPMLWLKTKNESVRVTNPLFIKPEIKEEMQHVKELHESFIKEAKKYAFIYPTFTREKSTENHCLVFDAADIHIGKICSSFETGETYNSQIAVQRVREGLKGIIQRSSGYHINKVLFIAGNDILHVDNVNGTTTRGTRQDTDGMWYDNFMMAKRLLVEIIETLLTIADVEVVYNPSNHDFTHGFMLLDSVSSWFHNCKQVTFDNDMRHRKYTVYGNNLIGTTHMDGIKVDKLHGLMAEEASEHWHACKHRYVYGHHIHHATAKDVFSVCIETLRSPSGADGWHHRAGHQHAPKAVVGFLHHETQGQVAKLTHIF